MFLPDRGARHNRPLPEPEGRAAVGYQAKPCEATGLLWVMRGYVESLAIYPGLAVCSRAQRARQEPLGVADVAVSETDGAGGGQYAISQPRPKVGAGGTAVAGMRSQCAALSRSGVVEHPTR
jgi:hypothetical protein